MLTTPCYRACALSSALPTCRQKGLPQNELLIPFRKTYPFVLWDKRRLLPALHNHCARPASARLPTGMWLALYNFCIGLGFRLLCPLEEILRRLYSNRISPQVSHSLHRRKFRRNSPYCGGYRTTKRYGRQEITQQLNPFPFCCKSVIKHSFSVANIAA